MDPTSKTHWGFNIPGYLVSLGFRFLCFFQPGQRVNTVCTLSVCQPPVTISSPVIFMPLVHYDVLITWLLLSDIVKYVWFPFETVLSENLLASVVLPEWKVEVNRAVCVCVSVTMSDRNRSELVIFHPDLSFFLHSLTPTGDPNDC